MNLRTFGERLLWARKSYARITQGELRARMKQQFGVPIGTNYISELEVEKDSKRVSFEKVRAMAGVLHVSLDWLAGFTDDPTPVTNREPIEPNYFHEESDEVARLVDAMRPEQRAIVATLARNLSALSGTRQRQEDTFVNVLNSIEEKAGRATRDDIARVLRDKGFPVD